MAFKQEDSINVEREFYCKNRGKKVTYRQCIRTWSEMAAIGVRKNRCWGCKEGEKNRQDYSYGKFHGLI
ncbi:MAG: hypothetical protein ABIJ23_03405 [Candidatus Magasanikbacteria bacterium]